MKAEPTMPTLLLWKDSALYVGPGFDAELHRHHALQLCVALDQPLRFRTATDKPWQQAEAVAINADQPHELQCQGTLVVLFISADSDIQTRIAADLFVDAGITAFSQDVKMLGQMLPASPAIDCIQGAAIKSVLLGLPANDSTAAASIDERVEQVMAYIQKYLDRKLPAELLAEEVALSADHLMTLFRKHVGLSIRQYVLWARIRRATEAVVGGMLLTEAAHEAGFSDSAHFTHSFRSTFGLPPNLLKLIGEHGMLLSCEQ